VPGQSVVVGANGVWLYRTNRLRAHQKMVLIKLERRVVLVVVKARLNGIAGLDEILAIQISDKNLLVAHRETVQSAIGILLEHGEFRRVVLIAIRLQVAEQAQPGLLIVEDESAKIAVERLNSRARGYEIVLAAEVPEARLKERFLHAGVLIVARGPLTDVNVDDAVLLRAQIIEIERGGKAHLPVDRTESRVATKKSRRESHVLRDGELPEVAE